MTARRIQRQDALRTDAHAFLIENAEAAAEDQPIKRVIAEAETRCKIVLGQDESTRGCTSQKRRVGGDQLAAIRRAEIA